MRKFSPKEKEYIRNLVKLKRTEDFMTKYPIDYLFNRFNSEGIVFDASDMNNPRFAFYRNENKFISKDVENLCDEFLEFAVLMRYLKECGLIFLFSRDEKRLIFPANGKYDDLEPFPHPLHKEIAKLLFECINCSIYITQALVDVVQNDFKSIEERNLDEAKKQTEKAHKTMVISAFTMIVALATLVVSIASFIGSNFCH